MKNEIDSMNLQTVYDDETIFVDEFLLTEQK